MDNLCFQSYLKQHETLRHIDLQGKAMCFSNYSQRDSLNHSFFYFSRSVSIQGNNLVHFFKKKPSSPIPSGNRCMVKGQSLR